MPPCDNLIVPRIANTDKSHHIRYQAVDGSFQWLSLERFEEFFQVERVARGNGGHRNLVRGRWLCVLRAVIEGPMLGGMSFLVL